MMCLKNIFRKPKSDAAENPRQIGEVAFDDGKHPAAEWLEGARRFMELVEGAGKSAKKCNEEPEPNIDGLPMADVDFSAGPQIKAADEDGWQSRYEAVIDEMRQTGKDAKAAREERRRAALERFVETGEGLPNWIAVHRRGSLNSVAVQHIRNVFPHEIETDEGKTLTRIAFATGAVLDVDESPQEVREAIWKSENFMEFPLDEYREVIL